MKTAFTVLLLLHIALLINAQNLVPNPSFEEFNFCPNSSNQVDSCLGWKNVLNTPDFFATCSPYPVSVPINFVGDQIPFDGTAYTGLITFHWSYLWREIIGTQLLDTLMPGHHYYVSMRVSRGNWTNMAYNCSASNKMGMRFTTYPYSLSSPPAINNYAQVYTNSIVQDTLNWVLLDWDFVPDSAYKYLYIGNFFDDAFTDTLVINAPFGQFGIAYYFIDSVNVFCIDANCLSSIKEYEGNEHTMNFDSQTKNLEVIAGGNQNVSLSIFNCTGQIINHNERVNNVINLSNLNSGIYIVRLETSKNYFTKMISIY